MKFQQAALNSILFALSCTRTSDAFVVVPNTNSRRVSTTTVSPLNALKGQLLPPPPPPPVTAAVDDSNILEQALREFQNAFGNRQVPTVGNLKEQVNLDALKEQLSSLDLGKSLPNFSSLQEQIGALKQQLDTLDASMLQQLQNVAKDLNNGILADNPDLKPVVQQISLLLQPLLQSPTLTLAGSAVLTYVVVSSILNIGQPPAPTQPYPLNKYDPMTARAYFDRRLPQALSRGLEILIQSLQFGISLLRDKLDDKIADNEEQRGRELAELLNRLGPTFIKVGQSLSIRTDLLSPAYIRGLETLQDQVPAFSTAVAKQILEDQWGQPISSVLMDELSEKPVAAAS